VGLVFNVPALAGAIAAIVMARADLKKMTAGIMDARGRAMTECGRILGILGTILASLGTLVGLVQTAFMTTAMWGGFRTPPPPPPRVQPAPAVKAFHVAGAPR
jgi:hypothetical protein